jgi:hypothetical protein
MISPAAQHSHPVLQHQGEMLLVEKVQMQAEMD